MTKDEALAQIRTSTEKLKNAESISEEDRDMILQVLLSILSLLTGAL
jgi:hypothetical protein